MVRAGAGSQDIRSQEAAVARARSERDGARLALEEAIVRSPADATVAEIRVNRGDLATQEQELLSLVRTDSMILRGGVDESDIGRVAVGQSVDVEPFGFASSGFRGEVISISQRAESQGNATVFFVDILVANPDGRLRWGMSADSSIIVRETDEVVAVPETALRRGGRSSTVLLAGGDGEETRDVMTGLADGAMVEIVSGLETGEEILVPVAAGGAAPSRGRFSGPGGIF